jgi:hypothetical protein
MSDAFMNIGLQGRSDTGLAGINKLVDKPQKETPILQGFANEFERLVRRYEAEVDKLQVTADRIQRSPVANSRADVKRTTEEGANSDLVATLKYLSELHSANLEKLQSINQKLDYLI